MPHPRTIIAAACLAALLAGCTPLTQAGRERHLDQAVDSLLPPSARVVARKSGDCTTLARSPSCVSVYYFSGKRSLRARERAAAARARESGWSLVTANHAIGGTALVFRRGALRATFELWAAPRYDRCLTSRSTDCADFISVVRR